MTRKMTKKIQIPVWLLILSKLHNDNSYALDAVGSKVDCRGGDILGVGRWVGRKDLLSIFAHQL